MVPSLVGVLVRGCLCCFVIDDCFVCSLIGLFHEGSLTCMCLCVLVVCCGQVVKGTWWMPWHREPMKDVGACEMPWGVGNRALIRGCPNGETQLESCPVTRT